MVLLCENTPNMFNASQYVQPDYLTPLPSNLDAKKSPLALLAQTCSQIGADSSVPKVSSESKSKDESKKSPKVASPKVDTKPAGVFRPFETSSPKPLPKSESGSSPATPNTTPKPSNSGKTTPSSVSASTSVSTKSVDSKPMAVTKPEPQNPSASPIIRSGMEVLQASHKDLPFGLYRPPLPSQFASYPGILPSELAMLRYPYLPGAMGYVPTTSAGSPFVAYPRPRLTTDTVCRDPYCAGCQLGSGQHYCPVGCTQCDHHKLSLLPSNPLGYPSPAHVCNWIVGNSYCGKRFSTSEELLQHLRTHTAHNLLASGPLPPSRPVNSADLRYHPYGKPQPMLHVPSPSFGGLYSPYSFLGGPR